jgi:5'(3')-deoxyribonucleotidase
MRKNKKFINPNKSILLDMDGIICDLYPTWIEKYNKKTNENIKYENISEYDLTKFVKYPHVLLGILNEQNFFLELEPIDGAIEYIKKITKLNLSIVIVTYVPWGNYFAHQNKQTWIDQHMPWFKKKNIIFAYRKHAVNGTLLFDDKPDNLLYWSQENPNGITCAIKHPYNKNIKADLIFSKTREGWKDFYSFIKEEKQIILS